MKVDHQKVCSTKVAENLTNSRIKNLSPVETSARGFVGGYIRRVTPVPIPNTVVKPAEPMILLQRESRSLPALNRTPVSTRDRGSFFCAHPSPTSLNGYTQTGKWSALFDPPMI